MSFQIDPRMNFNEVITYYEQYIDAAKAEGKEPVSFLHFLTGRY